MNIVHDDDGDPIGAIIKDHDPAVELPWILVPFDVFFISEARFN